MPENTMMVKVLTNFTVPNLPEFTAGMEVALPQELAKELLGRDIVAPVVVNVKNLEGDHDTEQRASKRAAK